MRKASSLRARLSISLLLVFTGILATGGALLNMLVTNSLYDQFDDALLTKARIVMTNSQQQNRDIRVYFSDTYLREFDDAIASEFFQVSTLDGVSVERSDSLEADNLPIRSAELNEAVFWNVELPNGAPGRAIGLRFVPRVVASQPGQLPAEAIVVVASGIERLLSTLQMVRVTLVGVGALIIAALYLTIPFIIKGLLNPISRVAAETTREALPFPGYRFALHGMPTEMVPICERLNKFLERLEQAYERERQFSSDIAHELRTPLSELRSLAEVALKWPEDSSPEQMETFLHVVQEMEMIVERLLQIARTESKLHEIRSDQIQIADLLRSILSRVMTHSGKPDLSFELDLNDVQIRSDKSLLSSILQNLIQNAVQNATPGTQIHCVLKAAPSKFILSIDNVSEHVTEKTIEHCFDRLWRGDKSRSSSGTGLGLTLAKSLATAMGFKLWASMPEPKVIRFTLSGPLQMAADTLEA